jgi:LemA protein
VIEIVAVAILFVIGLYALHVYNYVTSLDIGCNQVLNDLGALLERREQFFGNMLQQLGAGESYERQLMETVAKIREGRLQEVVEEPTATMRELSAVIARAEEYPTAGALDLKATYQEQALQIELAVLAALRRYNSAVSTFNTFIVSLPAAIFCSAYRYGRRKQFISSAILSQQSNLQSLSLPDQRSIRGA